jgi:hypothetical protein
MELFHFRLASYMQAIIRDGYLFVWIGRRLHLRTFIAMDHRLVSQKITDLGVGSGVLWS